MEEELKKKLDDKKKRRLLDINEERRMKELELEKSSGGQFVNLKRAINAKLSALDKENMLIPNQIFEEERADIRFKETLARMRDDNDLNIEKIKNMNEDQLEALREKLHQNYLQEA